MILLHRNVINIKPKHANVYARALVGNSLIADSEDGEPIQLGTIKSDYFGPILDDSILQMVQGAEKQRNGVRKVLHAPDILARELRLVLQQIGWTEIRERRDDPKPLKGMALVKAKLKHDELVEHHYYSVVTGHKICWIGNTWGPIANQSQIEVHDLLKAWIDENLKYEDPHDLNSVLARFVSEPELLQKLEAKAKDESDPEIPFEVATEKQASVVDAFFSQQVEADKLEKMLTSAFGMKVKVKPLSGLGYDIGETTLEELITEVHRSE
jgi:hypothetical protein